MGAGEPGLSDDLRADLHAYMGGTLKGPDCIPIGINSEPERAKYGNQKCGKGK